MYLYLTVNFIVEYISRNLTGRNAKSKVNRKSDDNDFIDKDNDINCDENKSKTGSVIFLSFLL